MYVIVVLSTVAWLVVAAMANLQGARPGRSVMDHAEPGPGCRVTGSGDVPRTRPTLDDVQGWLALTVLVLLVFALALGSGSSTLRGLVLVVGLIVVAWREERATRTGRSGISWRPDPRRPPNEII